MNERLQQNRLVMLESSYSFPITLLERKRRNDTPLYVLSFPFISDGSALAFLQDENKGSRTTVFCQYL